MCTWFRRTTPRTAHITAHTDSPMSQTGMQTVGECSKIYSRGGVKRSLRRFLSGCWIGWGGCELPQPTPPPPCPHVPPGLVPTVPHCPTAPWLRPLYPARRRRARPTGARCPTLASPPPLEEARSQRRIAPMDASLAAAHSPSDSPSHSTTCPAAVVILGDNLILLVVWTVRNHFLGCN